MPVVKVSGFLQAESEEKGTDQQESAMQLDKRYSVERSRALLENPHYGGEERQSMVTSLSSESGKHSKLTPTQKLPGKNWMVTDSTT